MEKRFNFMRKSDKSKEEEFNSKNPKVNIKNF